MAAIDKTYLKRWEDYTSLRSWLQSIGKVTDDFDNVFRPIDFFWNEWTEDKFNECIQRELKRVEESYSKGGYKWYLDEGLMTQEEYDNFIPFDHVSGIPIWNTPRFFDVWLIRNCPFDFIQNRLKEQYGGGWSKETFSHPDEDNMYIQIKNKTSCYDTYKRNGLGKNICINKNHFPLFRSRYTNHIFTGITVDFPNDNYIWYYSDNDYWASSNDLKNNTGNSSSHFHYSGYIKPKTLFRKLQKWDLPEGSKVHVVYFYKYTFKGPRFCKEYDLVIKKKKKIIPKLNKQLVVGATHISPSGRKMKNRG